MSIASPPTLAEALAAVTVAPGFSEHRRRAHTSALRALVALAGKPPEAVHLDPVHSLTLFDDGARARLGITESTLKNYKAAIRQVLRNAGLLAYQRPRTLRPRDSQWSILLDRLPTDHNDHRLRAFAGFCSAEGIGPHDVTQATLDTYCERRAAERGGGKSRDLARRIASQWNNATTAIPGWPSVRLGVTGEVRKISLPFEAYPVSLQNQIAEYLSSLAPPTEGTALFSGKNRARQQSTVITRKYSLRRILWGAVQSGIAPAAITSLGMVVELPFCQRALEWHFQRAGNKITADLAQFVATIMTIASFVDLDEPQLHELKQHLKEANPEPRHEITPRNAAVLQALREPAARAKLLHLPSRLMEEASGLQLGGTDRRGRYHAPRPVEAAWLASLAVAIEILLIAPIRLANLQALRIGQEVRLADSARGRWRGSICIDADKVKNRRALEFPIGPDSAALIHRYLSAFRVSLPNADSNWLFPGAGLDRGPRDKASFGVAIAEITEQHVGMRVNPHAFRALATALILEANPHAIDDVRAVLGHSTFDTAMTYYRGNNQIAAASRLSEALTHERRKAAPLKEARAPGYFDGLRPRRRQCGS